MERNMLNVENLSMLGVGMVKVLIWWKATGNPVWHYGIVLFL